MWRSSARARNSAALSPRVVSMRMSSGPSKRKLKPRSGLSICGERDAQVEQQAVDLRDAQRRQRRRHLREAVWWIEKRGS